MIESMLMYILSVILRLRLTWTRHTHARMSQYRAYARMSRLPGSRRLPRFTPRNAQKLAWLVTQILDCCNFKLMDTPTFLICG